ncbi:MAG TPA: hypothetical protein VGI50_15720 [Solirubrobacteraceae bacterium]
MNVYFIVIKSWWLSAGSGRRIRGTMSHNKIKAAARERMAATGEPYAAARRAVLSERRFFPISFDTAGLDWMTKSLDTLFGGGPGKSGVSVFSDHLHIRMSTFTIDVPLSSVRSLTRSEARLRGTTGVHIVRGRAIINGCDNGLVEFDVDPALRTDRGLSTGFFRQKVNKVVLSLVDPDGFIAAVKTPSTEF